MPVSTKPKPQKSRGTKARRTKNGGVNTRQRKNNRWSYYFTAGKKPNGRSLVVEKGGYDTERDAYEAGVAAFNDWKHGNIGITSAKLLLNDYIAHWLDTVKVHELRDTTMQTYRSTAKRRIYPYFEGIAVQDVTPRMVDVWVHRLADNGFAYMTVLALPQNAYLGVEKGCEQEDALT